MKIVMHLLMKILKKNQERTGRILKKKLVLLIRERRLKIKSVETIFVIGNALVTIAKALLLRKSESNHHILGLIVLYEFHMLILMSFSVRE